MVRAVSPTLSASSSASSTSSSAPLPSFETLVPPRAPTTTASAEVLVSLDFPTPNTIPLDPSETSPLAGPSTSYPTDAHPAIARPPGVRLQVDAGPGCGGIAWPAGEVLARFLAHRVSVDPAYLKGKKVLELGSGTGLVGIAAAMLEPRAQVWVTDQAVLLDLMRRNAELNCPSSSWATRNLWVDELNWGDPLPESIPTAEVDIVLAADCVYFEPAFPLLVQTLCDLAPVGKRIEILFCWKKRRKADKRFFIMLKKHFDSTPVDDDNPGEKERYNREGVTLLRLRRRG